MSEIQKPTRRYHKKSRNGCMPCRSRRIKCDETHPSCKKCQRAQLSCRYGKSISASESPAETTPSTGIPSHMRQSQGIPCMPADTSSTGFDMLDLTLMHHYTTSTSASLFGEEQKDLWQTEVPMMARSSSLLMHGLLATSALHMAFLHKDDPSRPAYTNRALYHHSLGLQLFNADITTLSKEDSNGHVLFTFGVLLVIWAYASPTIPSIIPTEPDEQLTENGESLDLDALLSSLDLVRGNKVLFELSSETISSQPIGAFTKPSNRSVLSRTDSSSSAPSSLLRAIQGALSTLRKHVTDFIDTSAIDHLERFLLETISTSARDMRMPLGWPALVEAPFWARVKAHKPPALLILMHYAVVLACYEDRTWWMVGWSGRLLDSVRRVLGECAGEDWRGCFEDVQVLVARVRVWEEAMPVPV
ncbi:hypothetical protein BDV18DRAFT_161819 [Aspergillus unguis]